MIDKSFARMKSEIEKEIEDASWMIEEYCYRNKDKKLEKEAREKIGELRTKLSQLLVDEKMVREEIEMQMKNDDRGLTPTKDVLRLILNRLGLEPSLPYKGEDVKALGLSEEVKGERK